MVRQSSSLPNDIAFDDGTIFRDWIKSWSNQHRRNSGDIVVIVENQKFSLHSNYLSFWSDYFRDLLTNRDADEILVLLDDVKKGDFKIIIDYLYDRVLRTNVSNVKSILLVAERFEIESFVQECCYNIISSRSLTIGGIVNILEFLCVSKNISQQWMLNIRSEVVKKWYKNYSSPSMLKSISLDVLKAIISSNIIPRDGVNNLIEICSIWVRSDFPNRVHFIPEMVNCITGKTNNFSDFSCDHLLKRINSEDVEYVFYELMYSCKTTYANCMGLETIRIDEGDRKLNRTSPQKMEIVIKSHQLYFRYWCHRMKLLRLDATKSDIIVRIDKKEYALELWILSVSSEFFRSLPPSKDNPIKLQMNEDDFEVILNFMYGKRLHLTLDNLNGMIRATRYLKINSGKKLILTFLSTNFTSIPNAFNLLNVSSEEHDEIWFMVRNEILRNFANIKHQCISCLTVDCLKTILSSDILNITKFDRLALCKDWVMSDVENRFMHVPELMFAMKNSFSDDDIQMISKFNITLKNQLSTSVLFAEQQIYNDDSDHQSNFADHDEDDFEKIKFSSRPFVIVLPLLNLCPVPKDDTNESVANPQENVISSLKKQLPFGVPFCIKLPLLGKKSSTIIA